MTDADLVYEGRARKRPPGASEFLQRLYMMLAEHPEGMTRDELFAELNEGWLDTDAYRAYQHRLDTRRVLHHNPPGTVQPAPEKPEKRVLHRAGSGAVQYGSEEFKRRAQKWWIHERLIGMGRKGTAIRRGDRWYAGRPPQVHTYTSKTKGTYVPLDVEAKRKREYSATQDNIRREELKARMLADLNARYPGPKSQVRDHLLETIQLAYNHLSGR